MRNENLDDLLIRLRASDKLALKVLFDQQYPAICSAIQRLIPDKNTVEDLAQEVFVRFWEKRAQIQINTSVQAYLRRMAINEALMHLRKNKNFIEEELTLQTPSPGIGGSAEEQYLHSELEHSVRAAIDELPPKCRAVFQLSRFEELTYQEIADQMGISIKTVENQMGKALRILRERLKGYLNLLL